MKTDPRDRARNLGRIAAVQTEMVKLAELKLDASRRQKKLLCEENDLLAGLASGSALGADLAKVVLRASKAVATRTVEKEREITANQSSLDALRQRGHVLKGLAAEAKRAADRQEEATALAETMEAWLARAGASLP